MASAHNLPESWTGLLLAGGASERMGQCKSQLRLSGPNAPTFLQYAWRNLQSICAHTFALGKSKQVPQSLQWQDHAVHSGPLHALVNGLPKVKTEWVLLIPVDMPGLTPDSLREFQNFSLQQEKSTFTMVEEGRVGFPVAIAHQDFDAIVQAQKEGASSLFSVLENLGCAHWTKSVRSGAVSLENINTPQQLRDWRTAQESACKPVL